MEKKCTRCGKIYQAERNLSRYCSPTCRQYAYLERNGLKINSSSGVNPSLQETKTPENESKVDSNSVNTVNGETEKELKPVKKNKEPIADKKDSVNSINNVSSEQLGELMQEIKGLKEQVAKNQLQPVQSTQEKTFQQLLDERLKEMDGENMFTKEHFFKWNYSDFSRANYVNERLKSYLNQLLKFHKEGRAEYRHLKSIHEKIEDLINSFDYKYLPVDYPYKEEIQDFSNRIKKIVENHDEDDEIEFRIRKSVRAEMQAMVIEIGNTVPDVNHCPLPRKPGDISQNPYYLAHKKKGFDILNM